MILFCTKSKYPILVVTLCNILFIDSNSMYLGLFDKTYSILDIIMYYYINQLIITSFPMIIMIIIGTKISSIKSL